MKRLCLSAVIDLSADPFEAAEAIASVKAPWHALIAELQQRSITHEVKCDEMEVRAKPQRRPRKPRLVQPTPDAA